MLNKLKFHFINSADMETPEKDEEVRSYFIDIRRDKLEKFASGFNLTSDEAGLLSYAKQYLETPEILHPLLELSAHKELANLAQIKITRLNRVIDEAEFELTKEGIEPKAKIVLPQLIKRLRGEFEIWWEVIRNGDFDVYQTRPYETIPEYIEKFPHLKNENHQELNLLFPSRRFDVQWYPEAAKVKKEPEEFRQIWRNPDEDIPRVFDALESIGFIDAQKKWIAPVHLNNPGGVIDALMDIRPPLLHSLSRPKVIEAFGKRLGFPYVNKRYEGKNSPYDNAKDKIINYLKRY
jgi:hypothetical protein